MDALDERLNNLVGEKAPVTSLVLRNSLSWFDILKGQVQKLHQNLQNNFGNNINQVVIQYEEKGERQCSIRVGEDLLFFHLQSNTFKLDESNPLYRSSYLKSNPYNAYCGIISVYNFLSDSIVKSKENDLGFLIARIFINRENHFYMEGKKQIGILFNDFANDLLDEKKVEALVKNLLIFSMEHDLFPVPFDTIQTITVGDLKNHVFSSSLATGKTLGFKLQKDRKKAE